MNLILNWNEMISVLAVDIYGAIKVLLTHVIAWKLEQNASSEWQHILLVWGEMVNLILSIQSCSLQIHSLLSRSSSKLRNRFWDESFTYLHACIEGKREYYSVLFCSSCREISVRLETSISFFPPVETSRFLFATWVFHGFSFFWNPRILLLKVKTFSRGFSEMCSTNSCDKKITVG